MLSLFAGSIIVNEQNHWNAALRKLNIVYILNLYTVYFFLYQLFLNNNK